MACPDCVIGSSAFAAKQYVILGMLEQADGTQKEHIDCIERWACKVQLGRPQLRSIDGNLLFP
jgi:hypothetical protein